MDLIYLLSMRNTKRGRGMFWSKWSNGYFHRHNRRPDVKHHSILPLYLPNASAITKSVLGKMSSCLLHSSCSPNWSYNSSLGTPRRLPIFLDYGSFTSLLSACTSPMSVAGAEWQLTSADLDEQCGEEGLLSEDARVSLQQHETSHLTCTS